MDNFNVLANENEDNQVNQERPPPRMCPRCNSNYTKFCYYNNYKVSQPRYFCKSCRRFWTHGGALRNIPIGGSFRKFKRAKVTRSSVSQMVSAEIRQYNQQPFLHVQENNNFVGSFGGSSSSGAVVNHFGSRSGIHNGTVENVSSVQNFRPIDSLDFLDELFELDNYIVGSIDSIGNPLINQSISGPVGNHNQVDQHKWNQSLKYNTMNMNDHNASTSGSGGSESTSGSGGYDRNKNIYNYDYKIRNNGVIKYP